MCSYRRVTWKPIHIHLCYYHFPYHMYLKYSSMIYGALLFCCAEYVKYMSFMENSLSGIFLFSILLRAASKYCLGFGD